MSKEDINDKPIWKESPFIFAILLFPTILDIVSIDFDGKAQIQGCNLPTKGDQYSPKHAIAEHGYCFDGYKYLLDYNPKFDVSIYTHRLKTIRTKEYKYIWASDGQDELYNIHDDPDELINLINIESEIAQDLRNYLQDWLNSFEQYCN